MKTSIVFGPCIVVLAVAGCGSSSKGGASGAQAREPAAMAVAPGPAMVADERAMVARPPSIFEVLPAGAEMAMGMNILQLRSSQLFTELLPWIKKEYGDSLRELESRCGIDPFTAVHSVIISGSKSASENTLVVARGLERPVLVRCIERTDGAGAGTTIIEDGVITEVREASKSTWIGWLDSSTLVMGPHIGRDRLEERLRGVNGLVGNAAMMELIDKVATESGLWLVFRQDPGGAGILPGGIHAIYGTVNVVGGLELNAAVRVDSAEQARSMADLLRPQLQSASATALGRYLTKIEVGTHDSDILLRLLLDDQEVADLVQLLAADPIFQNMFGP